MSLGYTGSVRIFDSNVLILKVFDNVDCIKNFDVADHCVTGELLLQLVEELGSPTAQLGHAEHPTRAPGGQGGHMSNSWGARRSQELLLGGKEVIGATPGGQGGHISNSWEARRS